MVKETKYPHIKVNIRAEDGNAFAVVGACTKAMKRNQVPKEEIEKFKSEAFSGDYNHLLKTCGEWVDIS